MQKATKHNYFTFYFTKNRLVSFSLNRRFFAFIIQSFIKNGCAGTSLYVNGKFIERLEGRKKQVYNPKYTRIEYMPIQETLVFPLKQIGDEINGFKGKIKGLRVEQE